MKNEISQLLKNKIKPETRNKITQKHLDASEVHERIFMLKDKDQQVLLPNIMMIS